MVTGAGCRGENPRLRRREKNVLDNAFYRSGVLISLRRLFAFLEVKTSNRDLSAICGFPLRDCYERKSVLAHFAYDSTYPQFGHRNV